MQISKKGKSRLIAENRKCDKKEAKSSRVNV